MEDLPISDALLPTQDGGKSSDIKEDTLLTKNLRSLKSKIRMRILMLRTETSKLPTEETILDNNGRSFMLTSTLNQRKESSTSTSDFSLKETSILPQQWEVEDMSILSTTETWLLRLQMAERPKFGISTNNQRPLELDTTTSHGISRVLEEQETCKSGQPTQDGSKCSNWMENSS
jgi:hypothetical protein